MIKEFGKIRSVLALEQAHNSIADEEKFILLYDMYVPKIFGFIVKHANTKDIAEDYLIQVFLKVWNNIKTLEENAEAKILAIMLATCKPIYKTKTILN